MDVDQLIAFDRIVREGSFSRAAWELHIAQPTISARIQALEQEVGGPLFARSSRKISLTALGTSFLPYARRARGRQMGARVHRSHRSQTQAGHQAANAALHRQRSANDACCSKPNSRNAEFVRDQRKVSVAFCSVGQKPTNTRLESFAATWARRRGCANQVAARTIVGMSAARMSVSINPARRRSGVCCCAPLGAETSSWKLRRMQHGMAAHLLQAPHL